MKRASSSSPPPPPLPNKPAPKEYSSTKGFKPLPDGFSPASAAFEFEKSRRPESLLSFPERATDFPMIANRPHSIPSSVPENKIENFIQEFNKQIAFPYLDSKISEITEKLTLLPTYIKNTSVVVPGDSQTPNKVLYKEEIVEEIEQLRADINKFKKDVYDSSNCFKLRKELVKRLDELSKKLPLFSRTAFKLSQDIMNKVNQLPDSFDAFEQIIRKSKYHMIAAQFMPS